MHIAFVCVVPRSVRHGGCPSCGGCAGRSRGAGRAGPLPGRAAVLSLSAPWQKSKRRDNDTPRSNSKQRTDHRRFKVQKGRSKKVQGQATTPASTTPHPTRRRRNGALRHSAHGRPQPSVITIRYPSRSYVTRYSTRGSPVAHAGRCSDALLLLLGAPCSSRRRGVFGPGTITQTHNHVGVVEWSLFPGISIFVLHMWLRVS